MPDTLSNAAIDPNAAPATSALAPAAAPALAQLPSPIADVHAGTIAAISLAPITGRKTDPLQEFVVQNLDEISAAGVDYHELPDKHSVLYNPTKVTPEQLDTADKAGKLFELAPLARELGALPTGPAAQSPQDGQPALSTASAGPASAPASASAPSGGSKKLQTARLRNMASATIGTSDPLGSLSQRAV